MSAIDDGMNGLFRSTIDMLKAKTKGRPTPEIGIICGSGLAGLSATLKDTLTINYEDIEGFPRSTVAGHSSEIVFGYIEGRHVICFRGRFHFYEGYTPKQVSLPVRVMAALGTKLILVTNASGGVNPKYKVGDIMIIKDHIALMALAGCNPLIGQNDAQFGPRFPGTHGIYDKKLMEHVESTAVRIKSSLKLHRGVYFGVAGPCYESSHEIGMIRLLGGEAVGMSTVFELLEAAKCGLTILGLALITNECKGPDDDMENMPTHAEVLESTKASQDEMLRLVTEVVKTLNISGLQPSKAYGVFSQASASGGTSPTEPSQKKQKTVAK